MTQSPGDGSRADKGENAHGVTLNSKRFADAEIELRSEREGVCRSTHLAPANIIKRHLIMLAIVVTV